MTNEAHPGAPRWVKVSAIVAGLLVVLVVVVLLVGGGEHGPGRHLGGDGPAPAHTPPPCAHP